MYIRKWLGIDLTELPAARDTSGLPAGPEFYRQCYEVLESRGGLSAELNDVGKMRLGKVVSAEVFDPWRQRQGRSPRVLALGVGLGVTEAIWLEEGRDVTLTECQEISLRPLRARFPEARVLMGDLRELRLAETYDVVTLFRVDYGLSDEELAALLNRAHAWLSAGGLFLLYSTTVLSLPQCAFGIVKACLKIRPKRPYISAGWRRTPGAFCSLARRAGFSPALYRISDNGQRCTLEKRLGAFQAWPPLRKTSLLMVFRAEH